MQIIVLKTLKSGKNLYLYLYRPSPSPPCTPGVHFITQLHVGLLQKVKQHLATLADCIIVLLQAGPVVANFIIEISICDDCYVVGVYILPGCA